jgi:N-acyl-L-homoserine lactone synthetase
MSPMSPEGLVVRKLGPRDLPEAGRLRHGFFVDKTGWVRDASAVPGEELDAYDARAIHHGVFHAGRLVGYMRALRGDEPGGMMLDHDFREALTDDEYARVAHPKSVELSRRVVAPDLALADAKAVAGLLFKLFYVVCLEERFENLYLVQGPSYGPMLRRFYGIELRPLNAKPYTFSDGTMVNVDHASIADLLRGIERRGLRPEYEAFHARYREASAGAASSPAPHAPSATIQRGVGAPDAV